MSDERLNSVPPEGGNEGPEGTVDLAAGAAFVTEGGRSPTGVTNAAPAAAKPPPSPAEMSLSQEKAQDGSAAEPIGEATLESAEAVGDAVGGSQVPLPRLCGAGRARGRRLVKKEPAPARALNAQQRLLLLDTWQRSGLPASDFAAMVGLTKHTLYGWKKKFDAEGPGGLLDRPRGGRQGSRLPELTKRTILMLKQANPEWGCQRISDMLVRGPALPASPSAVARVLHEAGYELEEVATRPHP